ncbi:tumor necrosis factor receptor superfamily member 6B [Pezoporus wallicus]|uniref:tumor necrosis factor receptor superfamily member 6B n=1 Tax=Pezoporus wallicus TaxID=35540 RepID=UPI00254D6596|nr:tumor necrosis factor receptor superfamily member 6B [Pezoporus wallicus]
MRAAGARSQAPTDEPVLQPLLQEAAAVPGLRRARTVLGGRWMFAPLLLLLLARLGCSTQHVYQWRDAASNEQLTCRRCPPGTFMAQHCTRDRPTRCEPCPDLHYTQYWNYLDKCRYCNVICGERQVEVQQCNATHNRVCQCQDGYYSEMEFCTRHSKCPPGFGVEKRGTPFENTQCSACPRGFFSSSASSTEPCQPHQDCEQQGKVVNVEGNQYHDTLCTSCRRDRGNSTQEPAPGDDDCEQAMIDFVAYQNIPIRKLKRLQQILEQPPRTQALGTRAAMQEKFRAFLTHLREGNPVTKELLRALRTAKLHSIEEQIRKRFLLR